MDKSRVSCYLTYGVEAFKVRWHIYHDRVKCSLQVKTVKVTEV